MVSHCFFNINLAVVTVVYMFVLQSLDNSPISPHKRRQTIEKTYSAHSRGSYNNLASAEGLSSLRQSGHESMVATNSSWETVEPSSSVKVSRVCVWFYQQRDLYEYLSSKSSKKYLLTSPLSFNKVPSISETTSRIVERSLGSLIKTYKVLQSFFLPNLLL